MTPDQKKKERERLRIYREKNRELILERKRRYREQNREKLRQADQAYREAKRNELAEKSRKSYAENREKVLEQKRKRHANASVLAAEIGVPVSHILFDAEKISAQKKEYRQHNREQIRERARRYYHAQKAQREQATTA
jgi:hypothetical protein